MGHLRNPSLRAVVFLPYYSPLFMTVCHCVLLQQWEFKSCQSCLNCARQHVPVQQTAQRLQAGEMNYSGSLHPLMFSKSINVFQRQFLVALFEESLGGIIMDFFFVCV